MNTATHCDTILPIAVPSHRALPQCHSVILGVQHSRTSVKTPLAQTIKAWILALWCAVLTSFVWGPSVSAGLDERQAVLTMLNAAYGPYKADVKGWVTEHEGTPYTVRVLEQRKVTTPYGERCMS
jgi:hypothetical protein